MVKYLKWDQILISDLNLINRFILDDKALLNQICFFDLVKKFDYVVIVFALILSFYNEVRNVVE